MGQWRKSSFSSSNGGACLETASGHGVVLVRDTTDRTGTTPVATFTTDNTGSFSGSWTIPAGYVSGNLKITATAASSGDVKSITYYVTGS